MADERAVESSLRWLRPVTQPDTLRIPRGVGVNIGAKPVALSAQLCFAIHPLALQPVGHGAKQHALLGSVTIGDACVFPLDCHPQGQRPCLVYSVYPGLGHSWLGGGLAAD